MGVDPYINTGVIGVLFVTVGALIWVIKFLFTQILPALNALTKAIASNTKVTKSSDKYLRERNGRDSKMHVELIKAVHEIPQQIVDTADITAKALREAPLTQKVDKQEVKTQVVKATI